MMTNKKYLAMAITITCLSYTAAAPAADFTFYPRAGVGASIYSISLTQDEDSLFDVQDTVPLLEMGGTLTIDRFYIDAYYQLTDYGHDESHANVPYQWGSSVSRDSNLAFDVRDFGLTLGYAITDSWGVFGGYRRKGTNIDESFVYPNVPSSPFPVTGTYAITGDSSLEFESDGFFLGTGYGWSIGNGILGIKVAMAKMTGDFTIDQTSYYPSEPPWIRHWKSDDGEMTGVNVGITWVAPITENLSYNLALDYYDYNYDFEKFDYYDNSGVNIKDVPSTIELDEEAYTIRAALRYRF